MDIDNNRLLDLVNWDFVPSWSKTLPNGKPEKHEINAKSETAASKPMFRRAIRQRRCLVPADGFYEWKKPARQPYYIRLKDDHSFAFAGIWESWNGADGFGIMTTAPNELMQSLHHRMPVILEPKYFDRWMDHKVPLEDLADLFEPFDSRKMEAYSVGKAVNYPDRRGPKLIERFTPPQGELFG